MSNEQLSVLLFHIMRQINEATSVVEQELMRRGCSLSEAERYVINLRGLADVLHRQSEDLDRIVRATS